MSLVKAVTFIPWVEYILVMNRLTAFEDGKVDWERQTISLSDKPIYSSIWELDLYETALLKPQPPNKPQSSIL